MQTTRSARLTRGAHIEFIITNANRMRKLVVEEKFRKVAAWHRPRISHCACVSPKCAMTTEAGGRNVERMRQPCCMEDGGRPSGCGLQDQPSNRTPLFGDKIPGGERTGKRREELVRCVLECLANSVPDAMRENLDLIANCEDSERLKM